MGQIRSVRRSRPKIRVLAIHTFLYLGGFGGSYSRRVCWLRFLCANLFCSAFHPAVSSMRPSASRFESQWMVGFDFLRTLPFAFLSDLYVFPKQRKRPHLPLKTTRLPRVLSEDCAPACAKTVTKVFSRLASDQWHPPHRNVNVAKADRSLASFVLR